ncbi:protein kinase G-activating protein GlnX [Nonomuraea monospora]|uniref:Protein kinase G-activating protein GlnX n=1 Tax=Nonomuraea monospora TaxID=568818 RepID=A0ABN3C8B7_9ACTN
MTVVRTSPSAPVPAAPPPAPVRQRSVPGRIRVISGITVASLALLFAALAVGSSSAREGLRVIGRDAGPQVVATAGLYLALSDMDAQVANVLVMGEAYAEQRGDALARYERQRAQANRTLLQAFELSGDNAAERATVQSVLDGLGRYERLAGRALLLNEQSGHAPGPPPAEVVRTYREATDLMRMVLLPQAYNLTLESGTIVRATYDAQTVVAPLVRIAVVLAGLVALGCLLWLQLFLARRFRRVFGPALIVATVTTVAALFVGASALAQDEEDLRTAKSAGFDSVLTLAKARAISNSMQGDQSRYLLDKERADTYEHTYLDRSLAVMYTEAGNLSTYHGAVAAHSTGYLGLLGPELVGRQGEEVAAAYRSFQAADKAFRDLATSGRTNEAVAARLAGVRTAFDAYDRELTELAATHQKVFERSIMSGEGALDNLWRLLPFAIGAIGVLMVAGVWPRLKEYR